MKLNNNFLLAVFALAAGVAMGITPAASASAHSRYTNDNSFGRRGYYPRVIQTQYYGQYFRFSHEQRYVFNHFTQQGPARYGYEVPNYGGYGYGY